MISKKDIIAMAKRVTHVSRGYKARKTIEPKREWMIGIVLFLVIAVTGSIFNAANHNYYNQIKDNVVENEVPIKNYQATEATTALENYQAREAEFDRLASDVPAQPAPVATSTAPTTTEELVDEGELERPEGVESVQ